MCSKRRLRVNRFFALVGILLLAWVRESFATDDIGPTPNGPPRAVARHQVQPQPQPRGGVRPFRDPSVGTPVQRRGFRTRKRSVRSERWEFYSGWGFPVPVTGAPPKAHKRPASRPLPTAAGFRGGGVVRGITRAGEAGGWADRAVRSLHATPKFLPDFNIHAWELGPMAQRSLTSCLEPQTG